MIIKIILRQTPIPTVQAVMDGLTLDEGTMAITNEIGDAATGSALYTQ
jgi:hypothetical protein